MERRIDEREKETTAHAGIEPPMAGSVRWSGRGYSRNIIRGYPWSDIPRSRGTAFIRDLLHFSIDYLVHEVAIPQIQDRSKSSYRGIADWYRGRRGRKW